MCLQGHCCLRFGVELFLGFFLTRVQDSRLINGVGLYQGGPEDSESSGRQFMTISFNNNHIFSASIYGTRLSFPPFTLSVPSSASLHRPACQPVGRKLMNVSGPTGGRPANNPNDNVSSHPKKSALITFPVNPNQTLGLLHYEGVPEVELNTVNALGAAFQDALMPIQPSS
ncbi:hypothetical protein DFH07DRAFT_779489 [Mycena maculata]|uniref:Uncharacterized protein n=1 Tax=Mycena maculata TaxID=230809 RepID=A0AAD7MXU5_9AGAR|nr:hypothetical protein DFH07DRAFT_779483 [Mycena maculata]KAJ7736954.1 hypothetical protein DFH07DRAFT_779489 [Mycena maculata]